MKLHYLQVDLMFVGIKNLIKIEIVYNGKKK